MDAREWVMPKDLVLILKSVEPEADFLSGDVYVRFNQS
ncbi:hypothetical protein CCP3SC15_680013 [Gammaproteobacteria bacterium]